MPKSVDAERPQAARIGGPSGARIESPGGSFTFEGRDDARGIRGTLYPRVPPTLSAPTLEELRRLADARIALQPSLVLELADDCGRAYGTAIDLVHHAAVAARSRRNGLWGAAGLVVVLNVVATLLHGATGPGLALGGVGLGALCLFAFGFRVSEIESAQVAVLSSILGQGGQRPQCVGTSSDSAGELARTQRVSPTSGRRVFPLGAAHVAEQIEQLSIDCR